MKFIHSIRTIAVFATTLSLGGCKQDTATPAVANAPAAATVPVAPPAPAPVPTTPPPTVAAPVAPVAPVAPLTASSSDAEIAAAGKLVVVMMKAVNAAAEAAGDDCDKTADGYDAVLDAHATSVAAAKTYMADRKVKSRIEAWLEANEADLFTRMPAIGRLGKKCRGTKKFDASATRLSNALRGR